MGRRESGAPVPAGDDLDLAAAFAREGQELFDRQCIRDPFGQPLGACGLIFEILDRVQTPPPKSLDLESRMFGSPWWLEAANSRLSTALRIDASANYRTTSSRTLVTPLSTMPSASAAEGEMSTTRPRTYGPRSLILTVTNRPDETSVTRSLVPNGRLGWAAVNSFLSNRSPLAVSVSE